MQIRKSDLKLKQGARTYVKSPIEVPASQHIELGEARLRPASACVAPDTEAGRICSFRNETSGLF